MPSKRVGKREGKPLLIYVCDLYYLRALVPMCLCVMYHVVVMLRGRKFGAV